jgi:hypothetical protein
MPASAELNEQTVHPKVFMLNETNDHIFVYMIFMFLKFCTSSLIPIHSLGIWFLNALLIILIWENSKFFLEVYKVNVLY